MTEAQKLLNATSTEYDEIAAWWNRQDAATVPKTIAEYTAAILEGLEDEIKRYERLVDLQDKLARSNQA